MRALNIIRGISKALMFVVLYFILYNYTQVFKPWLLICLAMVLLISIVLVIIIMK
jgi:hypothetical protein